MDQGVYSSETTVKTFTMSKKNKGIALLTVRLILLLCGCVCCTCAMAGHGKKEIISLIDRGRAACRSERYVDAVRHFMQGHKTAMAAGLHEEAFWAIYNLGVCYFLTGDTDEAMKNFTEAYRLQEKYDLGNKAKSYVTNAIAGVYFKDGNYKKAGELTRKCLDNAIEKGDSSSVVTYASGLMLLCNKEHKLDKALAYGRIAYRYLQDANSENGVTVNVMHAETHFLLKRYDDVIVHADRVLANKHANNQNKSLMLVYLINVYADRGELAKAMNSARKALPILSDKNKAGYYNAMAALYQKMGNADKAMKCKDSVIMFHDSLNKIADRKRSENSKVRFEIVKLRTDMEKKEASLEQHRIFNILLTCICMLVLIAAFQTVRAIRAKSRNAKKMLQLELVRGEQEKKLVKLALEKEQQAKQLVERQMRQTELEGELRAAMMKQKLDQKRHELSATTMFVSSRNALIEDLIQSLDGIKQLSDNKEISNLKKHLAQMLKENSDNDNFIINFESANPDFISRLKKLHPTLSASDIRFVAYIKMNLSTKEIASLININPESCKRRKIRLSKKLGLDTSADLYSYITQIG